MFRKRFHFRILARAAMTLAAALALLVGVTATAHAKKVTIWSHTDKDGHTQVDTYVDDKLTSTAYYGPENEYINTIYYEDYGNPTPDGQDTGLGPDKDAINAMLEQLLKKGGDAVQTLDFWETEVGKMLTESGKGPAVTDPWEGGEMSFDPIEGYGGGGGAGFDLNAGGIKGWIQKKQQKGKGKDDDGGDGGGKKEDFDLWGGYSADPAVVNPVPIAGGFTLMGSFNPTNAGQTGPSNSNVPSLGNANMLGEAMGRQAMNFGRIAAPIPTSTLAPASARLR